jgi:hypothetical protein
MITTLLNMTDRHNSNNIEHLKKQLAAEQCHLECVKKQLKNSETTINYIKQMIYNSCDHEWVVDSSNYNEHTEYICKKCDLSN